MTTAEDFVSAYKRESDTKPKFKHKMLMLSISMRMNGTDKLYEFTDGSILQVRELTNDWQVFKKER